MTSPTRPARPRVRSWLVQYAVAAAVFCAVDLVWLTTVADRLYRDRIGPLLREDPQVGAAAVFYALFVAGLLFFVIRPALARDSMAYAAGAGAFFGLVTYATFDLTNLAVLEGYPLSMAVIDLAWGVFLATTVSAISHGVLTRLPPSVR